MNVSHRVCHRSSFSNADLLQAHYKVLLKVHIYRVFKPQQNWSLIIFFKKQIKKQKQTILIIFTTVHHTQNMSELKQADNLRNLQSCRPS